MRIIFSLHLFLPGHCCGAELAAYQTLKFLQSKGHEVRVLHNRIDAMYSFDGIPVIPKNKNVLDQYLWADVVFTHLDYAKLSTHLARMAKKPLYFFSHNSSEFYNEMISVNYNTRVVYNCLAIKNILDYKAPSYILHPPCDYRHYDVSETSDRQYITIINCNVNKGILQFYEIAKRLPDRKFLAVKGSYDEQVIKELPNVTFLEKMVDIRPVYEQTKILLMPSEYESWGRTATEAMCSGIPVLATPTFGLKENIGEKGIFIEDRDNIDEWVYQIERLDDEAEYKTASDYAKERSRELDPVKELEGFNEFLMQTRYL